jgi:Xaa-Pro aminopeptidase
MRSKAYFKSRLAKFQSHFSKMGVGGFVIENPKDLAYFTGLMMSKGRLLITPKSATLFVDGRYKEAASKSSPYPVKDYGEKPLQNALSKIKSSKRFGFDTSMSVASHSALKKPFSKIGLKGVDAPTFLVRSIKDRHEIALLEKSATLLWKGFLHIRKKLKVGISEIELAREFEFFVKKKGAEALSFDPIIAFGKNSALPHHHSSSKKLRENEVVLMDLGVVLNGYASDMTRMVFFGEVPKKMQKAYELVRKAANEALKLCKPNVEVAKLDLAARAAMGKDEKHFIHSLGHGIGLDVHEAPLISKKSKKAVLEEGMVITIEPGIYLPNVGGIRYEDMIVITKTGYKNFFKNTKP